MFYNELFVPFTFSATEQTGYQTSPSRREKWENPCPLSYVCRLGYSQVDLHSDLVKS